jgi:acetoin utilization deacetylase AcuC-like enzyme
MRVIYSDDQLLHAPLGEMNRGAIVSPYECPRRASAMAQSVAASGLGTMEAPASFGLEPVLAIHRLSYVNFLRDAYSEWLDLGRTGDALPLAWPIRSFRSDRIPTSLDGRLSYYSFDISTAITPGTWNAIRSAANVALTGAEIVAGGGRCAFALCRPPGHHAGKDFYGGYCFLNNAAIAAQSFLDSGASRVTILDVDYHHGNGTQQIFYDRKDVQYLSINADPATDFPYFLGYEDETGAGQGLGYNRNFVLPRGTTWPTYEAALKDAIRLAADYAPDVLIISLGVDTFFEDPLSGLRLLSDDFIRLGEHLACLGIPTLIVMEGGYAIDALGENVVNVLGGFQHAFG